MGQTLTHGIYLPYEGERNCYNGLAANWSILDGAVGTIAEHTSALSGKAPLVHTHTKADITDFPAYGTTAGTICEGNDSRLSDARTPVAHTHLTADVTDFPDMALYPYKLAYTDNGGNFPYINLADSNHIALGFNGITDTGIYKVRATADVPGTPNTLTLDGILIVFNSDGTANVSSHRRCQQIFYQNSTTPKIFKRIGVFNITSQTWNWDTYKWVEYANTGRDFIPNETNSLNIGSSSNQWNNLYAKNYYYNGTAWGLDKANVWSAHQKIVGNNSRGTVSIYNPAYTKGSALSSTDLSIGSIYMGDGGQQGLANSLCFISTDLAANGTKTLLSLSAMENTASSGTRTNVVIQYDKNDAENPKKVSIGGTVQPNPDATFSLGTPSFRWKTLNGINPGALSLPNVNAVTGSSNTQLQDISGDLVQDQYFNCYFTPRMDGWVYIALDCSNATIRSGHSSYTVSVKTARIFANSIYTQSFTKNENAFSNVQIFIPVTANKEITLECTFTGFSVTKGYVIPCLGNV